MFAGWCSGAAGGGKSTEPSNARFPEGDDWLEDECNERVDVDVDVDVDLIVV
jgi:hypothetical protein